MAAAKCADESGWEANDATDTQEMPDFDFHAGLKMFDKRADSQKFREQDMTDDENIVVRMNKLATPSKYYAPTHNVLVARRESSRGRREKMDRACNGFASAQGIESPA